jgi:hypothetical protein
MKNGNNIHKHATLGIVTMATLLISIIPADAQTTNGPAVRPTSQSNATRPTIGPAQVMKQALDLTDDQVQKLEPVIKEQQAKVASLRANASLSRQERTARLKEIGDAANSKVKAVLTPAQAEKWQGMQSNSPQKAQQRQLQQRAAN